MKIKVFGFAAIFVIAVVIVAQFPIVQPQGVQAKQIFICWHHESQGQGDPSWDKCMPDDSVHGHDGHVGDHVSDVCENCGEEPTETAEPTATETIIPSPTPSFNFEWDVKIDCVQPFIRVHNLSDVTVKVNGEIWAGSYLVAKVPPQYEEVGPDQWGGPEGDMPANFVGLLTGWVKVSYKGVLVAQKEINQELNCAPTATPVTPTVTPVTPTATGVTLTPTSTQILPTSTGKPQITPQPVAPTGAADQDFSWVWFVIGGSCLVFFGARKFFKNG